MPSPLQFLPQICHFSSTLVKISTVALLTMSGTISAPAACSDGVLFSNGQLMSQLQKHNFESVFLDQIWHHCFRTGFPGSRLWDIDLCAGNLLRNVLKINSGVDEERSWAAIQSQRISWGDLEPGWLCRVFLNWGNKTGSFSPTLANYRLWAVPESVGQQLKAIVQKEQNCKLSAVNTPSSCGNECFCPELEQMYVAERNYGWP